MEYRLTELGESLCDEQTDGNLSPEGVSVLRTAVLTYSTANEARASIEYLGHSARPFLLLLRILYEISQLSEHRHILSEGIPKQLLSHCISGLWTEDETELSQAVDQVVRWAEDEELYEAELPDYIDKRYNLTLDEYRRIVTNNPARLGEWTAKLGLVKVSGDDDVYDWNVDAYRTAGDVQYIYGLSDLGLQVLRDLGFVELPVQERETSGRRYGSREESNAHKLLKNLIINFSDDEVVLGEALTLFAEEYVYPTMDRADLIMRDQSGRFVTIEVEVDVGPNDLPGTLQAAKYREMFAIERRLNRDSIRTMLVAFTISEEQRQLAQEYGIEVYEVDPDLRELAEYVE